MALGAEQGKVIGMVMREVLTVIAIGVGVGVPAALVLTRVVKSQLYGLEAHDPWTLGLATGLLAMVACAAGYVPALRGRRVDPMEALRDERFAAGRLRGTTRNRCATLDLEGGGVAAAGLDQVRDIRDGRDVA